MLKTVSTQLALASDTLSEILAKGNTSGANDIIMDNGSDIALGSSSQVTVGAGVITTRAGYIKIGTGAANLLFNSAASAVTPELAAENSDGTIDLGRSTSRFKALYLGEGVYLGGTTAANLLDDYEEGVYAATMTPETSGTTPVTSTVGDIAYTKVGRIVHIHGHIRTTSPSSPVGTYVDISLPFVIDDLTDSAEKFGNCVTYLDFSTSTWSTLPMAGISGSVFRAIIDASTIGNNDQFYFSFSYSTS
jgi:hypothetical protein